MSKERINKGMLRSAKRKLELLGIDAKEIADILKNKCPNAKSKLFEIVDFDSVWVEAKILEEDVAWIKDADDFELHFKTTPKISKDKAQIYLTLPQSAMIRKDKNML